MSNEELESFMKDEPTRVISGGLPASALMEQLRFGALLLGALDETPVGPCLVYRSAETQPVSVQRVHESLVVGRNEKADLAVRTPEMSSRHFRLCSDGADVVLEDLGSSNGTYVNQVRVLESQRMVPGDVIEAGGQLFLFVDFDADQ